MTKKTIKELADDIGVSKTAINKKIDSEFKRKHFSKEGNKFLVDEEGQALIKASFSETLEQKKQPETAVATTNEGTTHAVELVSVLKDRLTSMDKQLETKDEQIKQLQKLLDQQQVLTLQANKKIEQLELKIEEEPNTPKEGLPSPSVTPAAEEKTTAAKDEAETSATTSVEESANHKEEAMETTEASTAKEINAEKQVADQVATESKDTNDTAETPTEIVEEKKSLWKRLFK